MKHDAIPQITDFGGGHLLLGLTVICGALLLRRFFSASKSVPHSRPTPRSFVSSPRQPYNALVRTMTDERVLNEHGYVVLVRKQLEHRHLAEKALRRKLLFDEVVHHINGRKDDNSLDNLCVISREKHEVFHAWLRWKREKSGRYPSLDSIKKVLVDEYQGALLRTRLTLLHSKTKPPAESESS